MHVSPESFVVAWCKEPDSDRIDLEPIFEVAKHLSWGPRGNAPIVLFRSVIDANVPERAHLGPLRDGKTGEVLSAVVAPITDGYASLADVLRRALAQASTGKGHERHAEVNEPFERQVIADMARRFGVGSVLGQAFKKSHEAQRLPRERAVAELLGAINYLAAAVIHLEATP